MEHPALLLVGDSVTDQDLFYKTHFLAGDPFLYAERDEAHLLVVNEMERSRAARESSVDDVRSLSDFNYRDLRRELDDPNRALAQVIKSMLNTLGADGAVVNRHFPALYADLLRDEGVEIEVHPDLLVEERRHKSAAEIGAIERAQRATERSLAHAIDILRSSDEHNGTLHFNGIPLTAERLRSEIELSLLKDGVDTPDAPIVAPGPGASDPHWIGEGPIQPGQAIVFDIFPRGKQDRYFADMTRTVVWGEPSPVLRSMYDAVLRSQEAALALIRPGVNGKDVHEAVVRTLREEGFDRDDGGPRYIHGTGHGVGLDIHEQPGISAYDDTLQEGDVVSVEPGLYDPEIGGIRIEDLVVVTAEGSRNLTQFPKEFQIRPQSEQT